MEQIVVKYAQILGEADDLGFPAVNADSTLLESILSTVFLVTGALATIFIVVGGLRYVLSVGNSEKVQKAKNTILYAVVGLVLSIFALGIVNFVIANL